MARNVLQRVIIAAHPDAQAGRDNPQSHCEEMTHLGHAIQCQQRDNQRKLAFKFELRRVGPY